MEGVLVDGPGDSAHVLVLAHGSGMPMDAAPMRSLATGLGARGVDVVRFEFPYMQARRRSGVAPSPGVDADSVLAQRFTEVVTGVAGGRKLMVGGWSRGGRIAAQIARPVGARALVCLSYPFHPLGRPRERDAVERLRALALPTLIVQGSRDAFGNREQVRGYRLDQPIRVHWLEDANHALRPRARSGFSAEQHLAAAIAQVADFILGC